MNVIPVTLTSITALCFASTPVTIYVSSESMISAFQPLHELCMKPIQVNSHENIIKKITGLSNLKNNWDGYGAINLDFGVIQNSLSFLQNIPNAILDALKEDDITATPYGTIVMDFSVNSDLISVEVGEKTFGFFSEFQDGSDFNVDSVVYNSKKLPIELVSAFNKFHKEILA